jgi:hypothetical protein
MAAQLKSAEDPVNAGSKSFNHEVIELNTQ